MVTERLKRVFAAGSIEGLFPLLKDWPKKELRALIKDVEAFGDEQEKTLKTATSEIIFKPEIFFNEKATKQALKVFRSEEINLVGSLSEIISVALFYLD